MHSHRVNNIHVMDFASSKLLNAVAKQVKATDVRTPDKTETKFNKLLYYISKTYFDLATKTARTSGHKTVTQDHVRLMSDLAYSMRGGAETVLPSEYFGRDSGAYHAHSAHQGSSTADLLARPALHYSATGGGCPCGARVSSPTMMGGGGGVKKKANKKKQCGGAETVLPSEYFSGIDSGQYFAHDVVAPAPLPDTLARLPLPQSGGGSGSPSITARMPDDVFGKLWQEYKSRTGAARDMRMSAGARGMLKNLISSSLSDAVKAAHTKHNSKALTPACIDYAIKHYSVFPYR